MECLLSQTGSYLVKTYHYNVTTELAWESAWHQFYEPQAFAAEIVPKEHLEQPGSGREYSVNFEREECHPDALVPERFDGHGKLDKYLISKCNFIRIMSK